MRLGEECPYITPCGWCSRQEKPCEKKPRYRVDLSAMDMTPAVEALNKMASALNLPEVEETETRDMAAAALIQASQNFMKLDTEQETDTLSSAKGYCAASRSIKKY